MENVSVLLAGVVLLGVILLWKISIFLKKWRSARMKTERSWLD